MSAIARTDRSNAPSNTSSVNQEIPEIFLNRSILMTVLEYIEDHRVFTSYLLGPELSLNLHDVREVSVDETPAIVHKPHGMFNRGTYGNLHRRLV